MIDYTNSQISQAIDEYIHSERNRNILKRRLIDGICYEPLAEEFDMQTYIKCPLASLSEGFVFAKIES